MPDTETFTPLVHIPRWLMFSRLAEVIGPTNWAVLLALVATESRLLNMEKPKWKAEVWEPFKLRERIELCPQTGLSTRTVSRALAALAGWQLIAVKSGGGRDFTTVQFNHAAIENLASIVMPRLPRYQGGFANREQLPEFVTYWTDHNWGWKRERAEKLLPAAQGQRADFGAPDIRAILTRLGGSAKPKAKPTPKTPRKARAKQPATFFATN